jgi:voltage-gated potassium channel
MGHAPQAAMAQSSTPLLLRDSMRGLYLGAALFLSVIVLGASAYVAKGWSFLDAFYMVIITVFSVGYEEVRPIDTLSLHVITILIIVAGDACKVYFVGSLVGFITGGEIGRAMDEHRKSREIESIDHHAIICGYGRIGQTLARELAANQFPFLILDNNEERVALAHAHGFQALIGDAGAEATLAEAHIERAVVFATVLPSDMVNVFITLTARNMRPDLRIIARAEDPATEKKLRQAGANEVILPAFVGGMQIANRIVQASLGNVLKGADKYLKNDLKELGVEIVERPVAAHGIDDRKSLQQLTRDLEGRSLVLGVRKPDGSLIQQPPPSYRLEAYDVVLLLSNRAAE